MASSFHEPWEVPEMADIAALAENVVYRLPGVADVMVRKMLQVAYADFARLDTVIFEHLRSTAVSLRHKESGRGVRVEYDGFPMLAFWTPGEKRAPFLCIEPWQGCAAVDNEGKAFTDKRHCVVLAAGEVKELSYTVSIL